MTAERVQELEEIAAKLLATARKLSPGPVRHRALNEIGTIRVRIIALQARPNSLQTSKLKATSHLFTGAAVRHQA
jgi:hypothetical protein